MSDGRVRDVSGGGRGVRQPVDGGKPTQLTDFKADDILFFDWSHDGRQLVLALANVNNDIVLVSDAD